MKGLHHLIELIIYLLGSANKLIRENRWCSTWLCVCVHACVVCVRVRGCAFFVDSPVGTGRMTEVKLAGNMTWLPSMLWAGAGGPGVGNERRSGLAPERKWSRDTSSLHPFILSPDLTIRSTLTIKQIFSGKPHSPNCQRC